MAKSLVIVESPTKVKTIKKYLGEGFEVMACMGHVRGLPSRSGSVDVKKDFDPLYEVLPKSSKHLKQIKKVLPSCDKIYLATDLDREGEAIAWHLLQALNLDTKGKKKGPEIKRITFHEITKQAIDEAMQHPRKIFQSLVDAQQARVVMDYLYGFNLSPFLWRKVRSGLSAGRVQSPALKMICERELEIQAFKEDEYWTIGAALSAAEPPAPDTTFNAHLVEAGGNKLEKLDIKNEEQARKIESELQKASYKVQKVQKRERSINPPPPLITSTLQQEASNKLGFSAKKTMTVAQQLYEGVDIAGESEGLITYMRTDSLHIAATAIESIRECIKETFGPDYLHSTVRQFKTKSKTAQEAHEAIRPTDVTRAPEAVEQFLSPDQLKLYNLIWKRAIASQMAQSLEHRVSVDIKAGTGNILRAVGTTVTFAGFRKVLLPEKDAADKDESILPPLSKNQDLTLLSLNSQQHFTKPPPRYTEASLVKALEEQGIGRPSTYATIISVLQDRDYVRLESRRFIPQEIGMVVHKLLKDHFTQYVDYQFTAKMEEDFDNIAQGKETWKPVVRKFWDPFSELLKVKNAEVKKSEVVSEPTDEVCPECGKPLVNRLGPYSRFLACTGYPKCRYTKPLGNGEDEAGGESPQETDEVCEKCGKPMTVKRGRYGTFLGCSGYPDCKNTKRLGGGAAGEPQVVDQKCEKCGADLVVRRNRFGKLFLACPNYPKCTFATAYKQKAASE